MDTVYIFKRTEKKYMLSDSQYEALIQIIGDRLTPDAHGRSTVISTYLDTPDFLLIRNSIDAVSYKEKLRLRCYGNTSPDSTAFLEIKKKYMGVVYKRRISLKRGDALKYIYGETRPPEQQIVKEIDYALSLYNHPLPMIDIACERDAFFSPEAKSLRLTFDRNIRYRRYGANDFTVIQPKNTVLLEIKTANAMPLWLSETLSKNRIFPAPYSKYATAYRDYLLNADKQKSLAATH